MISMTSEYSGTTLTVFLTGRIDSANAPEAEQTLKGLMEGKTIGALILDFKGLEYISSAGLRILLRLKKQKLNMQVVNVSSEVYEILDMTGFTDMMDIIKAYRQLDLTGCEVIGKGSNGTVYRYTDDIVVKVYHNNDALADIQRERKLARTALVLGVNTAISYDIAQVGDRYGSVFELIDAKTLTELLLTDWAHADQYIKLYCDLLKTIHETPVKAGVLPEAKLQYLKYAGFLKDHIDDDHAEKLIRLIEAVPDQHTMIHGDYHTGNVYDVNGEAVLIDMDTLAVGNPVFEFASIYLAYRGFNELEEDSSFRFMGIDKETGAKIWDLILKEYFGTSDEEMLDMYTQKFKILGYTRLLRRTIRRCPDEKGQIEYMKDALCRSIDAAEKLYI